MNETCYTCTIFHHKKNSNRNPCGHPIWILCNDHNLTKGQHSNWFVARDGKSCKLGTHVPGDCGTIWCRIHTNKAKEGRYIHFKGKYMHMLTACCKLSSLNNAVWAFRWYTCHFATVCLTVGFDTVCFRNMVGDCFDMLYSSKPVFKAYQCHTYIPIKLDILSSTEDFYSSK